MSLKVKSVCNVAIKNLLPVRWESFFIEVGNVFSLVVVVWLKQVCDLQIKVSFALNRVCRFFEK